MVSFMLFMFYMFINYHIQSLFFYVGVPGSLPVGGKWQDINIFKINSERHPIRTEHWRSVGRLWQPPPS